MDLIHCLQGEGEGRSEGRLLSRNTTAASTGNPSPLTRRRRKRDLMEVMEEEAQELLSHFNHRNVDALLRLTRNTLEGLRKRIHASSLMHFLGETPVSMGSLGGVMEFDVFLVLGFGV